MKGRSSKNETVSESRDLGSFLSRVDSAHALNGRLSGFVERYMRNRAAVFGLGVLTLIALIGTFSPWLAPYPPTKTNVGPVFLPPQADHIFGTDHFGRDVLSEVIHGARTALIVSVLSVGLSSILAIMIGAAAGFFGGVVDEVLMRITEFFLIMPIVFLAVVFAALFGSRLENVIWVIAVLSWPSTARLLRSEILSKKEAQFVEAARSIGLPTWKILFSEILPNSLSPVIVNSSLLMSIAVILEAALSFLGLGDPNVASWGRMMANAQPYLSLAWWMPFFPGIAITLMVLSLNLVGDGFNDALNPRLRGLQ